VVSVSCFVLHTRTPSSEGLCEILVQDWRDHLTELVSKAKARARRQSMLEEHGHGLLYYRAKCRNLYEHSRTQLCVAVLIILAFAVDIGEAQLLPQGCGQEEVSCGALQINVLQPLFTFAEIVLTSLFTLELLINMLSKSNDYFRPFWSHFENIFDMLVVVVSIFSLMTKLAGIDSVPNIKMLRLVRVFRVVRLFKRFKSLNRIILASHVKPRGRPSPHTCFACAPALALLTLLAPGAPRQAISASLLPVANALFILLIFTCIYAVLATHLFGKRSAEFFGSFHASFFTMIQIVSGDAWASTVSRGIFEDTGQPGEMDSKVATFFVTYYLLASGKYGKVE
jgi:hypothetical protein